jgi:hypothetical protein
MIAGLSSCGDCEVVIIRNDDAGICVQCGGRNLRYHHPTGDPVTEMSNPMFKPARLVWRALRVFWREFRASPAQLSEHTSVPADYLEPDWGAVKVHDWKRHIYDELRAAWPAFTDQQRKVLARNAEEEAFRGEWW